MRKRIRLSFVAALRLAVVTFISTAAFAAQGVGSGIVVLHVTDAAAHPVANVLATLSPADPATPGKPQVKQSNSAGDLRMESIPAGIYSLEIAKKGFFPVAKVVQVASGQTVEVTVELAVATANTQSVTVTATGPNPVSAGAAPAKALEHSALKELPVPGEQVSAALPLVPGVVRTPDGRINIDGARENENALLINSADASDPGTGDFGVDLPLDVVEEVRVFQAPYLAEYGQFTGGITKIETRGGTDKFKTEINDFFPEPRFRSGSLFGFRGITPRARVAGPIIPHKLFFSQGANYNLDKTPIRGLPFPHNLTTTESKDLFSQLDWIVDPQDVITFTSNFAPGHVRHDNLDVFLPEFASPDRRSNSLEANTTLRHSTASGSLIESIFNVERFSAAVWPEGTLPFELHSAGAQGNFFNQQSRRSSRIAWEGAFVPLLRQYHGQHQFKFGSALSSVTTRGNFTGNPVLVFRPNGTLSQRLTFLGGSELNVNDTEFSAYAQDQWLLNPKLSIDAGLRYEQQSEVDDLHVAPRVGLSYAPGGNFVVRGGIGIFYERLPLNVVAFPHYPSRRSIHYDATGQHVVFDRTLPNLLLDFTAAARPRRFEPGHFSFLPYSTTWNVSLEKRFTPRLLVSGNFLESNTRRQFVVDVVRDGSGAIATTLRNSGTTRYAKLELVGKYEFLSGQLLNLSFVHSRARGDLNDFTTFFGGFADPLIRRNQYGTLPFDIPNRFLAWGVFHLPMAVTLSPIFEWHTGFPYSVLNADYSYYRARNSRRFPQFQSLDLTLTKDTKFFDKYTVRYGFDVYNTLGHFNPRDVQANRADRRFGSFLANQYRYFVPEFDLIW